MPKKKAKKFPKVKVILNTVLAFLFGGAAPLIGTYTQNNVQTAAVATYTANIPYIAGVICLFIAICFAIRAGSLIVRYIKDKIDEDKNN